MSYYIDVETFDENRYCRKYEHLGYALRFAKKQMRDGVNVQIKSSDDEEHIHYVVNGEQRIVKLFNNWQDVDPWIYDIFD